jgi:hypothetical protein
MIMALQGLMGGIQLLDALGIVFYPTIHRVTSMERFELGFSLVVPLALLLVAWVGWMLWRGMGVLASYPLVGFVVYPFAGLEAAVFAASLFCVVVGLYASRLLEGFVKSVLLLISAFEGLALLHWLIFVPLGVGSPLMGLASLELDLFYVVSYLAPLLVLPLLFMWLLKLVVGWGWGVDFDEGGSVIPKKRLDGVWVYLSLTVLLSVFAVVYPYFPNVNPRGLNVGVDISRYVASARLVDADVSQAFSVSGGSRPLIFLVIFGVQRLTGLSIEASVNYLPVLLAPVLVLSAFFLARVVSGNDCVAVWSAFFTSTGIQITVGIYSYFLTNMLALSLAFLSSALLLLGLRRGSYLFALAASFLGGLLLFTHPWTFDQLLGSVLVFALYAGYEGWRRRRYEQFYPLIVYVGLMGFFEFCKSFIFQGIGSVGASSAVTGNLAGLGGFWAASIFGFRLLYGGFESNVLLISLSLIGVYLLKRGVVAERFFVVYCVASSLVFLVGDDSIKARLLYNLPFALFSGVGLHWLLDSSKFVGYRKYVFSGVVLSSLVYLFRCLGNLV